MAKSIKTNYILNLINTGTQFLFPLISFPYVSRIMGPDGIGLVNFYQSIISYVILIAGLGIPMYGIKEVARVRDDKEKLSQTTFEILSLHIGLTVIAYIVVAVLAFSVPQINENVSLFMLLSLSILFTTIGCDWFYKGIEDFKYITILGIIVKTVALLFLFVFVKERQDILWYGAFCVIGTLGGNVFNFLRLRKFLNVNTGIWEKRDYSRHLKPILQIFLFSVITSLYLNLNPVILGFIKDEVAVGYYATALKIFTVIISVSSSVGTVMLPRMSYLIAGSNNNELENVAQKTYNFSLGISLPICVFLIYASPYAVRLLCGNAFDPSILCVQILAPIIVFLAISSLMGTQILYPMGEIKIINRYCAIGAALDLTLSFVLVPLLAQMGTSISYAITEFCVMLLAINAAKEKIHINILNVEIKHYLIGTVVLALLFFIITYAPFNDIIMLLILCIVGVVVYLFLLLLFKDPIIQYIYDFIKIKK